MNSYHEIFEQSLEMLTHEIDKMAILNYMAQQTEHLLQNGCAVSILRVDCDGALRNCASPSLPADYIAAIDGIKPNPNLGTCAAAAATGKIVITRSFLADNKWAELKHLPLSIGFASAWSVPIIDNRNIVLGTIGVYQKEIKVPQEEDKKGIELLSKAASQILSV